MSPIRISDLAICAGGPTLLFSEAVPRIAVYDPSAAAGMPAQELYYYPFKPPDN